MFRDETFMVRILYEASRRLSAEKRDVDIEVRADRETRGGSDLGASGMNLCHIKVSPSLASFTSSSLRSRFDLSAPSGLLFISPCCAAIL